MKKLIFVFLAMFIFSGCAVTTETIRERPNHVCYQERCFEVETAKTPEERSKGLMFRDSLGDDKGMLFIFEDEGIYPFWMKNTLIPLDIIWTDLNYSVVFISKNAQPCKEDPCPVINPGKKARYVLEINGGLADEIGLKDGSEIRISLQKT